MCSGLTDKLSLIERSVSRQFCQQIVLGMISFRNVSLPGRCRRGTPRAAWIRTLLSCLNTIERVPIKSSELSIHEIDKVLSDKVLSIKFLIICNIKKKKKMHAISVLCQYLKHRVDAEESFVSTYYTLQRVFVVHFFRLIRHGIRKKLYVKTQAKLRCVYVYTNPSSCRSSSAPLLENKCSSPFL